MSAQIVLALLFAQTQVDYHVEHLFPPEDFHNHSSSIVETPGGDLIACWFHGKGERKDDSLVILGARKNRGAQTWSKPFVMADNPNLPDQNCTLFIDPNKRLWLFWTSALDNEVRSFFPKYRYSVDYEDDGPPVWAWQDALFVRPMDAETAFIELREKRLQQLQSGELLTGPDKEQALRQLHEREAMYGDKLFQRIGWLPRQPPVMLTDKRMMLGLYSDTFDCSLFAFTEDAGHTWEFSRPLMAWGIQPAPIQKTNGDLLAYLRASPMTRCVKSTDHGWTWTEVPLDIPNAGSSIAALRLNSGNWLLAVNDDPRGRHQLSLYLSNDEGETWTRKRFLEHMDPTQGKCTASYPTLIQSADGQIHCTYTHANASEFTGKSIRHAWFSESWVEFGSHANVDNNEG
ncbi:MAG: exo-alpha-sialidase [Planctomycetaceae bacterium]|nr:exo-alpha-sialidase [Planctomycetaceae bacterium]